MNMDRGPCLGLGVDGDLRAGAHGEASVQLQIEQHGAGGSQLCGRQVDLQVREEVRAGGPIPSWRSAVWMASATKLGRLRLTCSGSASMSMRMMVVAMVMIWISGPGWCPDPRLALAASMINRNWPIYPFTSNILRLSKSQRKASPNAGIAPIPACREARSRRRGAPLGWSCTATGRDLHHRTLRCSLKAPPFTPRARRDGQDLQPNLPGLRSHKVSLFQGPQRILQMRADSAH